jgi:hypothetical protein
VETLTLPRLLGRAWGVVSALLGFAAFGLLVWLAVAIVWDLSGQSHPAPKPAHVATPREIEAAHNWLCTASDGRRIKDRFCTERHR